MYLMIYLRCKHVHDIAGYYTRSGYVPGPVCKYNWTKTWDMAKQRNNLGTRIFSYLTKDEGEIFPGKLACDNRYITILFQLLLLFIHV